ncbi:MAG: J domain-containing protein [Spirochaetaceae bacterium]|nr:J domain-containing protein [Spirochaetaceae bacterium]
MDQILDRLERLVRSWVNATVDGADYKEQQQARRPSSRSGNPDFDAAMAELDDFLDTGRTETEKREAREQKEREARERRERAEWERRARSGSGPGDETTYSAIVAAYKYLGLAPFTPFSEVRTAYKKLLFKYHPDKNNSSPEALKKATETTTRINTAYQIIETYEESKKAR